MSMSRNSTPSSTSPGMTLTALVGFTATVPTVPTRQVSSSATMVFTAVISLEAASRASRRLSMGVVPAWLAVPLATTWNTDRPVIPDTTPTGTEVRCSTGPCSMCSSR